MDVHTDRAMYTVGKMVTAHLFVRRALGLGYRIGRRGRRIARGWTRCAHTPWRTRGGARSRHIESS